MAYIITIAQQKGGAGKSTICAHLAVALYQKGNRVTIIDIDPQGSLKNWFSVREEKFGVGYAGINFKHISGWKIGTEITDAKFKSDFIIIDSPPHTDTEAKSAIRAADLVIIPVQPSPTDLWATEKTLDFALSEKKTVKVLLNRFNSHTNLSKDLLNKFKNIFAYKMNNYVSNRVAFASSLMHGKTVIETEPNSPGAKEIKAICEEVLLEVKVLSEA